VYKHNWSCDKPFRWTNISLYITAYYDSNLGSSVYLNTGWSTAKNKGNEKILTQEAEIVLAHEIGKLFPLLPASNMIWYYGVFFSTIVCTLLVGTLPTCPDQAWQKWLDLRSITLQKMWISKRCRQPGKNSLKYSAMTGNWTRATKRTESEIHSFSYWTIITHLCLTNKLQ